MLHTSNAAAADSNADSSTDSNAHPGPDADADTCAYGRRYLRVRRCLRNGQYL